MRTLKLTIAYDGARYVGWQRQATGRSIQETLELALVPLERGRLVRLAGAGRTDAGVHALGQVASCRVRSALPAETIRRALNARLPPDVRVLEVAEVPVEFHARFWAREKMYAYHVLNGPVEDPLARGFVWHVAPALDLATMRAALNVVIGRHDFRGFQAAGSRVSTTVRTLSQAAISARPWAGWWASGAGGGAGPGAGHRGRVRASDRRAAAPGATAPPVPSGLAITAPDVLITFEFRADGFLRHMVRNIVGTVVEVGLGRRSAESVELTLEARDRRRAGITAPPQGLCLMRVEYGDGPVGPVARD